MSGMNYILLSAVDEATGANISVWSETVVVNQQQRVSVVVIPAQAGELLKLGGAPLLIGEAGEQTQRVFVITVKSSEICRESLGRKVVSFTAPVSEGALGKLKGSDPIDLSSQSESAGGMEKKVSIKMSARDSDTESSESGEEELAGGGTVNRGMELGLEHLTKLLAGESVLKTSSKKKKEVESTGSASSGNRMDPSALAKASAPADSSQLLNLLILQKLEELTKAKKRGSDSSDSSEEEDGRSKVTVSFDRYRRLKARRTRNPRKIIRRFRRDVLENRLAVIPGQSWAMKQLWKAQHFQRCRSIGRAAWILLEILQQFENGSPDAAHATTIHGFECLWQFALDGGAWEAAWPLSLLEDPWGSTMFASSEENLGIVAGLMKARTDLRNRISCRSQQQTGATETEEGQEQDTENPAPKAAGKRKP